MDRYTAGWIFPDSPIPLPTPVSTWTGILEYDGHQYGVSVIAADVGVFFGSQRILFRGSPEKLSGLSVDF